MTDSLTYRTVGTTRPTPNLDAARAALAGLPALRYHAGGYIEAAPPHVRAAVGDDALLIHAIWWDETALIRDRHPVMGQIMTYEESFDRGSIDVTDRPLIALQHIAHGGTIVGFTYELRDEPYGLDAIVGIWAHEPAGADLLARLDRGERVPTSIGFHGMEARTIPPTATRPPRVIRTRASLGEIATLVDTEPAYKRAGVVGRTKRPRQLDVANRLLAGLPALSKGA